MKILKEHRRLAAIEGGVVTSVRIGDDGQIIYRYRIPPHVAARHRKIVDRRHMPKDDNDIGQGEGCEGGKCQIRG